MPAKVHIFRVTHERRLPRGPLVGIKGMYIGPVSPGQRAVQHAQILREIAGEDHILPRQSEALLEAMHAGRFFGGGMARWPTRERDPMSISTMIEIKPLGNERLREVGYCIAREEQRGYKLPHIIAGAALATSFLEDGDDSLGVSAITHPDALDAHRSLIRLGAVRIRNESHARSICAEIHEYFCNVQEIAEQRHPGREAFLWLIGESAIRNQLEMVYQACTSGLTVVNSAGNPITVFIEGNLVESKNCEAIWRMASGEASLPIKLRRF